MALNEDPYLVPAQLLRVADTTSDCKDTALHFLLAGFTWYLMNPHEEWNVIRRSIAITHGKNPFFMGPSFLLAGFTWLLMIPHKHGAYSALSR